MVIRIGIIINMVISKRAAYIETYVIRMRRLIRYKRCMMMLCLVAGMAWGAVLPVEAQKKEIAIAKDQVKAGKDLDKAQQSMEKLLKDSVNRSNRKIWTFC